MKTRLRVALLLCVSAVVLVSFFQNCSPNGLKTIPASTNNSSNASTPPGGAEIPIYGTYNPGNIDPAKAGDPELPRQYIDTTYALPTGGNTFKVLTNNDFNAALTNAIPGDIIELRAGNTFTGPFKLPNKPVVLDVNGKPKWIYIVTSELNNPAFPAPQTRVSPAHSYLMPKIIVSATTDSSGKKWANDSNIITALNANHFRFVGIEFSPGPNVFSWTLFKVGVSCQYVPTYFTCKYYQDNNISFESFQQISAQSDVVTDPNDQINCPPLRDNKNIIAWKTTNPKCDSTVANLASDITIDRCYMHGDPNRGSRRAVATDGIRVSVIDSYLSDFKEYGADTQAVWAYNTPGPLKVVNNYLESSGENIIYGGADPSLKNIVPSDIEVRHNHLRKPLSWFNPINAAGEKWSVKNLLEFKNAQRVLIEGNIFQNNWPYAQNGHSILVTPRNQDGGAPWSRTQHITIRKNKFNNLSQGFNIAGYDGNHPEDLTYVCDPTDTRLQSCSTTDILIENNVIDVTGLYTTGCCGGHIFQILSGVRNLTIRNNTAFAGHTGGQAAFVIHDDPSRKVDRLKMQNNIIFISPLSNPGYGYIGSGTGTQKQTLGLFANPNYSVSNNVLIGQDASYYGVDTNGYNGTASNFFPATISNVGFQLCGTNELAAYTTAYQNSISTKLTDAKSLFDFCDLSLSSGSLYFGKSIGANVLSINQATTGAN